MYPEINISDKPALLDMKKRGYHYCLVGEMSKGRKYFVGVTSNVPGSISTVRALEQIEAMEKGVYEITWNEYINRTTVEEKLATMFGLNSGCPFDMFDVDKPDGWCESHKCHDCKRCFLNSPCTKEV